MLENLRYAVDIPALLIALSLFGAVGAAGLWFVHRTTGRPYRDMMAVLCGAIVLILLFVPIGILFKSYGPASIQRWLLRRAEYALSFGAALLVWWAFNRWGSAGSRFSARGRRKDSPFAS
jgi:uncharacterized protein YqgC (DUF456 family)